MLSLCVATSYADSFNLPGGGHAGVVSSVVNVFPNAVFPNTDMNDRISLSAAKGESESAQIVIASETSPVAVERVSVSDLKSKNSIIKNKAILMEIVGYADLITSSWRGISRTGLWPDPIIAMRPFECPAGESRSLWVTITIPRSAKAGEYKGTLTLFGKSGKLVVIPFNVKVYEFTLPEAPFLHTSYWMVLESRYNSLEDPEAKQQMLELFGQYRTSTNLLERPVFYLEKDGQISCDASRMKKTLQAAVKAGFRTLNLGSGCWSHADYDNVTLIDRKTGKPMSKDAQKTALDAWDAREKAKGKLGVDHWFFARMYMNDICDWLQSRKLLDRCYVQLFDEESNPGNFLYIADLYNQWRQFEPRARYLGLLGVHPDMQGVFDVWSPHIVVYDKEVYRIVSEGISLKGKKNFAAEVSASSTGTSGTAAFYAYRPIDAYDGCEYTKWTPAANPVPGNVQWLRFDFKEPADIDGIRISPYEESRFKVVLDSVSLEVSKDGQSFERIGMKPRSSDQNVYDLPRNSYKSVKIVFSANDPKFTPTSLSATVFGVREVELVRAGMPMEATLPRAKIRKSEMWEYQVGADFPGVCIDANPTEIGYTGPMMFQRKSKGYLNFGAGQWQMVPLDRPKGEDPLVWHLTGDTGSGYIVYPGSTKILPSVRFARFRDGVDDYDYMTILESIDPGNALIKDFRENGVMASRDKWAKEIELHRK
jgi:hypothetical protein